MLAEQGHMCVVQESVSVHCWYNFDLLLVQVNICSQQL